MTTYQISRISKNKYIYTFVNIGYHIPEKKPDKNFFNMVAIDKKTAVKWGYDLDGDEVQYFRTHAGRPPNYSIYEKRTNAEKGIWRQWDWQKISDGELWLWDDDGYDFIDYMNKQELCDYLKKELKCKAFELVLRSPIIWST